MATDDASQQANRSGMDPQRLVVIFYLSFGLIFALFMDHVLGMLWANFGWADPEIVEGLGWKVSTLVGVLLAVGTVAGAYAHPRTRQLSMEVASELMKVTWPTWAETRVSAVAVVVDWLPVLWGKL